MVGSRLHLEVHRPKKRTVLILAALLCLTGITVIVWEVADWPPPRLILKYGFPPNGGPTGRTKVIAGIRFAEIAPGTCKVCLICTISSGTIPGRIGLALGLPVGGRPWYVQAGGFTSGPRWIEVPETIWLSTEGHFEEELSAYRYRDQNDGRIAGHVEETFGPPLPLRAGRIRAATQEELQYACGFPGFRSLDHTRYPIRAWRGNRIVARDLSVSNGPGLPPPFLRDLDLKGAGGIRLVWIPPEDE